MSRVHRAVSALVLAALATMTACGGGDDGSADGGEYAGYVREPAPQIDVALPDASNDLEPYALKAPAGGLLLLYFGYTNCPDFCPTTMSDLKLAMRRLADSSDVDTSKIDIAMVTVDPERDFVDDPDRCDDGIVLGCYVRSFLPDGHALGTDDLGLLDQATAPLGASYTITKNDDAVEVSHTTSVYVLDDTGTLRLTWPFGTAIDDVASDIEKLMEDVQA